MKLPDKLSPVSNPVFVSVLQVNGTNRMNTPCKGVFIRWFIMTNNGHLISNICSWCLSHPHRVLESPLSLVCFGEPNKVLVAIKAVVPSTAVPTGTGQSTHHQGENAGEQTRLFPQASFVLQCCQNVSAILSLQFILPGRALIDLAVSTHFLREASY